MRFCSMVTSGWEGKREREIWEREEVIFLWNKMTNGMNQKSICGISGYEKEIISAGIIANNH